MTSASEHGDDCARPGDLVTIGELRALLGVRRSQVQNITNHRAFPAPWYQNLPVKIQLWRRQDIEPWLDRNRPGWRDQG